MYADLIFGPHLHEQPSLTNGSKSHNVDWRTHGASDCFAVPTSDVIERPTVLVIPPGELDADLRPNEKMVD